MMDTQQVFTGVDLSGGVRRLTVAVLSPRLEIVSLQSLSIGDAVEKLAFGEEIVAAIDGSLHLSVSPAESREIDFGVALRLSRLERARAAEAELSRRGIPLRLTPAVEGAASSGVRAGLALGRELAARGFKEGADARGSARWLIETQPTACFAALLGHLPLGRGTLEGRLQRQLILLCEKVELPDPMEALEEITEHHLLAGHLTLDGLRKPEELDAIAAAYIAWRAWKSPDQVVWLGREVDGWICLPVGKKTESVK